MKKKSLTGQIFLNIVFIITSALVLLPFLLLVSASISNETDILEYGYRLIPERIDFSAYKYVFENPVTILRAYGVTAIFSVTNTVFAVLFTAMLAYGLMQRDLPGKNFIGFYVFFTMLFSGGLVPTYLLISRYLHLTDTIWVYILTGLISPWYAFMMRTFFQSIPYEVVESCYVDGANEFQIFFKIILPLSKPVLATVALFTLLGKWQDWMTSMYYINDPKLYSLQYMLQRILKNIELLQMDTSNTAQLTQLAEIPSETVRMAMAVVVAGPALVVFPFFQKYFVKGMTVGSVKG